MHFEYQRHNLQKRGTVYTKINQSKYTCGNLIQVDVTNKLLDVRNEILTAVNTRVGRYYVTCTGTQVPRLGGGGGGGET